MIAVLGVVGLAQAATALMTYSQLRSTHENRVRTELRALPAQFEAVRQDAVQSMVDVALQLGVLLIDEQGRQTLDQLSESPIFGSFIGLQLYAVDGQRLLRWQAPGTDDIAERPQYAQAAQQALQLQRPGSLIDCGETGDCLLFAFVPSFDGSGRPVCIVLWQPLAGMLLSFQKLHVGDVAVLAPRAGSAPRLLALTDAPRLQPLLADVQVGTLPQGQLQARAVADRRLRLLRTPLAQALPPAPLLLFVLDETEATSAIRTEQLRAALISIAALLLASAAVYLILTPSLRRLRRVTEALPMLAERQFAAARRRLLRGPRGSGRDEIDTLREVTLALAHRLETLDQAEAESEEKSRFLATMSHEIRTPMNGMLGLLELLDTTGLPAEQRELLRIARQSGSTLLQIIDDVLIFSRLEAVQLKLEVSPFALREVVEDAVGMLAPLAHGKGLALDCYIDPALPETLSGDALRLRQILFNLCSNAIKFTEHGAVQVRIEALDGGADGAQRLKLRVLDTGIGLAPEARQRLFRPFSQADAGTTRRYGGTGLGLSIVRGLVQRMGGQVDYLSAPGAGSEFWCQIELPVESRDGIRARPLQGLQLALDIADATQAAQLARYLDTLGAQRLPAAALRIADAGAVQHYALLLDGHTVGRLGRPLRLGDLVRQLQRATVGAAEPIAALPPPAVLPADAPLVLVAEDHPVNQEVIVRQLARLGYRTEIAGDGAEAMHRLGEHEYALLLADLHMPNVDGLQLARWQRDRERGASTHLPMIALTAAGLSGEREACRAAGFDDFLLKPVRLDELQAALMRQLGTASTPLAAAEPVDRVQLLEISGGDRVFAARLLHDFARINRPALLELGRCCGDGEHGQPDRARQLAHRLLGSARTIGALPLALAVENLQRQIRAGQHEATWRAWLAVQRSFDELDSWRAGVEI